MKTRSEALLAKLSEKTFLSYWSHANIFKSSGRPDVPNKEVCDVLVVFGNDVVIFSDKEIQFQRHKSVNIAWERWYRKAILDSAKQLLGARRFLLNRNSELFLDEQCQRPLKITLPSAEEMRIHLVVVAHGLSSSGSLTSANDRLMLTLSERSIPFCAHQPFAEKQFIHILDSNSLQTLLDTMDTAVDLIKFLNDYEKAFSDREFLFESLEDVLAGYVRNTSRKGYSFPDDWTSNRYDQIVVSKGFWDEFSFSSDFHTWMQDRKASRLWDELIEKFISYWNAGVTEHPRELTANDFEKIVRTMGSTSRLERRVIVQLVKSMVSDESLNVNFTFRRSFFQIAACPGAYLTLLCFKETNHISPSGYKTDRLDLLSLQSQRIFNMQSDANAVVGIGLNPIFDELSSEDYVYMERSMFSQSELKEVDQDALILDIFQNVKPVRVSQRNFDPIPEWKSPKLKGEFDRQASAKKIGRNQSCPCGSGIKYKKCCLRKFIT